MIPELTRRQRLQVKIGWPCTLAVVFFRGRRMGYDRALAVLKFYQTIELVAIKIAYHRARHPRIYPMKPK